MESGQQPTEIKTFARANSQQRLIAAITFLSIMGVFLFAWLLGRYHISLWPFGCGFKQRYGLPCPTCGMTTAVIAFAQGRIIHSFCAQPAAALFCCIAVITAFFAFLIAVFGIYSPSLQQWLVSVKLRYVFIAVFLVLAAGWAVTLARAIAERGGY